MVSFKKEKKKYIIDYIFCKKKKIVKVFTYIVITNIPVGKNSNFLGFSQKKNLKLVVTPHTRCLKITEKLHSILRVKRATFTF